MKILWTRSKPFLRWLILGAVLFFLGKTLTAHWQEVATLQIDPAGFACLTIALGMTLLAHVCAGWVWSWILQSLNQPVTGSWGVEVYLKTNIAKYLPGNLWHFYGRIAAATKADIPVEAATLSILLEPLLMVAAALLITLISLQIGDSRIEQWQPIVGLVIVLASLHPRCLNPAIARLTQLKQKATRPLAGHSKKSPSFPPLRLKHYPWRSLLGELGFLGLRGMGFVFVFLAIQAVSLSQIPTIMGAFAIAWLLGFVTPGLPGGVGVFEAAAIALLRSSFSPGDLISVVALYRLINTLAEAAGAGLVSLSDRR
ncbi:lysylphosphatidylglycerol synthase domain-containing protein [Phormidesmis priestleyi]